MARLSVTKKFPQLRRLKATSKDTRGRISCCTDTPNCQSYGRTPEPWSTSGLTVVSTSGLPNAEFEYGPQKSPPDSRRSTDALLARPPDPQSGMKLPFASVQVLVVVAWY